MSASVHRIQGFRLIGPYAGKQYCNKPIVLPQFLSPTVVHLSFFISYVVQASIVTKKNNLFQLGNHVVNAGKSINSITILLVDDYS